MACSGVYYGVQWIRVWSARQRCGVQCSECITRTWLGVATEGDQNLEGGFPDFLCESRIKLGCTENWDTLGATEFHPGVVLRVEVIFVSPRTVPQALLLRRGVVLDVLLFDFLRHGVCASQVLLACSHTPRMYFTGHWLYTCDTQDLGERLQEQLIADMHLPHLPLHRLR